MGRHIGFLELWWCLLKRKPNKEWSGNYCTTIFISQKRCVSGCFSLYLSLHHWPTLWCLFMLQAIPLSFSLWLRANFQILYYFLVRSSQLTLVVFSETNRVGNLTCPSTFTSRSYCRSLVQLICVPSPETCLWCTRFHPLEDLEIRNSNCVIVFCLDWWSRRNNHHVLSHQMSNILFDYYDILFQLLPARFYRIYDHNNAVEDGVDFGVLDKLFTTNHQVSHHKCLLFYSKVCVHKGHVFGALTVQQALIAGNDLWGDWCLPLQHYHCYYLKMLGPRKSINSDIKLGQAFGLH